jgi:hypothetical protein
MDQREIDTIRTASQNQAGGEVVRKCLDEIERLRRELHQAREDFSKAMGGSYSE